MGSQTPRGIQYTLRVGGFVHAMAGHPRARHHQRLARGVHRQQAEGVAALVIGGRTGALPSLDTIGNRAGPDPTGRHGPLEHGASDRGVCVRLLYEPTVCVS
jgi:hypothetical protein